MVSIGPPTLILKSERPSGPGHGQPLIESPQHCTRTLSVMQETCSEYSF